MLKKDCKNFPGNRPCIYHKEENVKCETCSHYNPLDKKLLIIKLDAIGDVLRTTAILPPLKEKYPNYAITWCTKKASKELFKNNSYVDDVIVIGENAEQRLDVEEFDIVINLDNSKLSSALATKVKGKTKIGFLLNKKGFVEPTSDKANYWLELAAFDDLKRENKKSHQQIMYEILELDYNIHEPIIQLSNDQINKSSKLYTKWKFDKKKLTLGLNIGVGSKWPSKAWAIHKWKELVTSLAKENYNLLLLGGPEEENTINEIKNEFSFIADSGCDNSLLEFSGILNLCDILITADTLALHIATALKKYVVALIGPSSINEITLYNRGFKLSSDEPCRCFYNKHCKEDISCMEKISVEQVLNAVKKIEKNIPARKN